MISHPREKNNSRPYLIHFVAKQLSKLCKSYKKKTILNSIYRKNFFVFAYFQKKTAGKAAAAAPAATTEKAGKAGGKGGKKGEINHNDAIHAFYASASKLSIF